jgi:hypothetical protein
LSQLSTLLTFAYSGDPYDFVAKDLWQNLNDTFQDAIEPSTDPWKH